MCIIFRRQRPLSYLLLTVNKLIFFFFTSNLIENLKKAGKRVRERESGMKRDRKKKGKKGKTAEGNKKKGFRIKFEKLTHPIKTDKKFTFHVIIIIF